MTNGCYGCQWRVRPQNNNAVVLPPPLHIMLALFSQSAGESIEARSRVMPVKFNDVKQGEAIMFNNEIWVVFKKDLQTRGNLRSYYQVELKNLERGNVYLQRFSPEDNVEQAVLIRQEYEYLYTDGAMLVLMNPETYDQI